MKKELTEKELMMIKDCLKIELCSYNNADPFYTDHEIELKEIINKIDNELMKNEKKLYKRVLIGYTMIELYIKKDNENKQYIVSMNKKIILTTEDKYEAKKIYLQWCYFYLDVLRMWL